MGQTIDDDVSAASAGMHRLTVFHVNPFFPAANITVGDGMPELVMYGAWTTTVEVPAGAQTIGLDVLSLPSTTSGGTSTSGTTYGTGTAPSGTSGGTPVPPMPDGNDDFTISADLADGGWSYVYVTYGYPTDPPLVLHHVRGAVNTPLLVSPAM